MFKRTLAAAYKLLRAPKQPEHCVACTLPIEPGSPAYPYARGGRVHADCAFGRFASYERRDSPVPFEVEEQS